VSLSRDDNQGCFQLPFSLRQEHTRISCPMYHTKGFACLKKKSSPLTSQLVPPDQRWCVSDSPQGSLPWGGPPGPWGSAQHAVPVSLRLCPWSHKTHPPEKQGQGVGKSNGMVEGLGFGPKRLSHGTQRDRKRGCGAM